MVYQSAVAGLQGQYHLLQDGSWAPGIGMFLTTLLATHIAVHHGHNVNSGEGIDHILTLTRGTSNKQVVLVVLAEYNPCLSPRSGGIWRNSVLVRIYN